MSANVPQLYPARRLPEQPNLEQLRKRAKDLLKQYREGHPAAVAKVRQFEHRVDPAVFALSDAQRFVARAYGYPSWAKQAFVDGANVARLVAPLIMQPLTLEETRKMIQSRVESWDLENPRDRVRIVARTSRRALLDCGKASGRMRVGLENKPSI